MAIYPNIYQTLVPCPIVELRGYLAACGLKGRLYAYLDYNGPTGTSRDSVAEGMLALAAEKHKLLPGQPIIEAASGSSGLVDNPRRTVPLATMLGALLAGLVYIGSSQAIAGMFPASVTAASGAPFALSASLMVGDWAAPVVAACTVIACLTSLGSWMLLVTQAGARAARDGHFPKIYGELDHRGMPRKGLILAASQMTGLMLLITALNAKGGSAASLFEMITEIAVLLTMLPYFYSCIDLLRIESTSRQGRLSCIAAVLGCGFCFIALAGAGATNLMLTIGVSLVVMMIYSWRMGTVQANRLSFAAQPISSSAAGS